MVERPKRHGDDLILTRGCVAWLQKLEREPGARSEHGSIALRCLRAGLTERMQTLRETGEIISREEACNRWPSYEERHEHVISGSGETLTDKGRRRLKKALHEDIRTAPEPDELVEILNRLMDEMADGERPSDETLFEAGVLLGRKAPESPKPLPVASGEGDDSTLEPSRAALGPPPDPQLGDRSLRLFLSGREDREIAEAFSVTTNTVRNWRWSCRIRDRLMRPYLYLCVRGSYALEDATEDTSRQATIAWFSAWRQRQGLATFRATGLALGVHGNAVRSWLRKKRLPRTLRLACRGYEALRRQRGDGIVR